MMRFTRALPGPLVLALACSLPVFGKCQIPEGGTVVVRAAAGDLHVDTTAREAAAEVQVDNAVQLQENCSKDGAQYTGSAPDQMKGTIDWKIVVPKNIHLDLVTMSGNITVGDVDGSVVLRTAGGSVTAGNIKGRAAIITQAGFIKSGNI